MEPVADVAGWWALFGGSHVLLATSPVRSRLVRALGERGFLLLFTAVASVFFAGLVRAYAVSRYLGVAGPGLGGSAWARPPLIAAIVAGFALMIGAFAPRGYWTSPMMILATGARPPYGLERVTRHPFFAGLVLFASAHALLASHLVGTVFFGGLCLLSIAGAAHQGRKLLKSRPGYDRFLATTSAVPFAAIAGSRQKLVLSEIPWVFLLIGVVAAAALRHVHASIWDHDGIYVSGGTIAASVLIGIRGFTAAPAGAT